MIDSSNAYLKWLRADVCKMSWRFFKWLFLISSFALSGCASTGQLSAGTHIRLEQGQPTNLTSRLIDARPISEKVYRVGVKTEYPESVALGDENFSPDRLRVLDIRLQNALGEKLKEADKVVVDRFEVIEYIKDIKTPTAGEIVENYANTGVLRPSVLALPIAIPIRQMMDRVITPEAEVELCLKVNGKSFSSKMAVAPPDVGREYAISEAFEAAFKYLVYDLDTALQR